MAIVISLLLFYIIFLWFNSKYELWFQTIIYNFSNVFNSYKYKSRLIKRKTRSMIFFFFWSMILIAYSEPCRIHDLWRRFSFGTRDQAWSCRVFVWQKFYYSEKVKEKASDIDIRRGMESAQLANLIKALYTFTRLTAPTYILRKQD